jgi:hypothetical protein
MPATTRNTSLQLNVGKTVIPRAADAKSGRLSYQADCFRQADVKNMRKI